MQAEPHILVLTNRIPWPLKDGGALGMHHLIRGLAGLPNTNGTGCKVSLLSMNTSRHYLPQGNWPDWFDELAQVKICPVNNDITPWGILGNLISGQPYHVSRFIHNSFKEQLKTLLMSGTFTHVHLECIQLAPYIPIIRQCTSAVLSVRAPNVEYMIWERISRQERNPLRRWFLKLQTRRLRAFEIAQLNLPDAWITVTAEDAQKFREMGCTRPIMVSPTGLFRDQFAPGYTPADPHILFHIGSMDWQPNLEGLRWFLDRIWPRVHSTEPKLKLQLAGRRMPVAFLELQIPGVTVLGEVEDARKFIDSGEIMIVPLLSGSGMRVKMVEGMARAKAIVSTSIGAEGLGVRSGHEAILADSPQEFAQAILDLAKKPELRKELGNKALDFARLNFGQEEEARKLFRFLEDQRPS